MCKSVFLYKQKEANPRQKETEFDHFVQIKFELIEQFRKYTIPKKAATLLKNVFFLVETQNFSSSTRKGAKWSGPNYSAVAEISVGVCLTR